MMIGDEVSSDICMDHDSRWLPERSVISASIDYRKAEEGSITEDMAKL